MCVKAFFPKPPDPAPLPPAKKPDPIVQETKPQIRKLIDADSIAQVKYGQTSQKRKTPPKQVSADSLKINIGGDNPAAASGGLNVG